MAAPVWTAIGKGVAKNKDGTITVQVKIIDESTQKFEIQTYTDTNLLAIQVRIQKELQARVDNDGDASLSKAVVGVELARV